MQKKQQNIVYLTTYLDEDLSKRFNLRYFPAGLKKKQAMIKALGGQSISIVFVSMFTRFPGRIFLQFKTKTDFKYEVPIIVPMFTTVILLNYILNPIFTIIALIKLHIRKRVDVVLLYNSVYENIFPALFMKLFFRVKIVCQYEDGWFVENMGIKTILYRISHFIGKGICDGVIANSQNFIRLFSNKKGFVFRGLIDEEQVKSEVKNDTHGRNIVFSSNIDYIRGIELLCAFLESAETNKVSDFTIHITGRGNGKIIDRINSAVNIYNKRGGNAIYHGFVTEEKLSKIYGSADIFLSLQKTDLKFSKYCFPSKIYDFVPFGKPIISTRISDLSKEEFGNLYFIDYDVKSLLNAIHDIVTDYDKYHLGSTKSSEQIIFYNREIPKKLQDFVGAI